MSQTEPTSNPAQTYEDYFVPGMFRPWTEELLSRGQPQPSERVLDVACGTGIVARLVAQQLSGNAQISGLDLNPAMIEVARATAEREGLSIDWHVGKADALPFPDGAFDLVLVQQGVQFFPDRSAAVRELRRVLISGGRVATATWTEIHNNPFFEAFATIVERHLGSPAVHTPYSLGKRDDLQLLFNEAGFTDVRIDVETRDVRFASPDRFIELGVAGASAAVVALQTMSAEERAQLVEAVRADMAEPIARYTRGDELVFPMQAHILVARKAGRTGDHAGHPEATMPDDQRHR